MTEAEPEYDDIHMRFLELLWGDGYLSPGGPASGRHIGHERERLLAGATQGPRDVVTHAGPAFAPPSG